MHVNKTKTTPTRLPLTLVLAHLCTNFSHRAQPSRTVHSLLAPCTAFSHRARLFIFDVCTFFFMGGAQHRNYPRNHLHDHRRNHHRNHHRNVTTTIHIAQTHFSNRPALT
jgi:hypothetical protein